MITELGLLASAFGVISPDSKRAAQRNPSAGFIMPIAAVFFAVLIFLMYASLQYLVGVQATLELNRLTLASAQAMNQASPSESGALASAAWVARLSDHGLEAEAVENDQGTGDVTFRFEFQESGVSPDGRTRVFAQYDRELGFLSGFFGGYRSGVGLQNLRTVSRLGASHHEAFTSIFVDISTSMVGEPASGGNWPINLVLEAAGYRHDDVANKDLSPCYPLKHPVTNSVDWRRVRSECNEARKNLPFILGPRAAPIAVPSPGHGLPGFDHPQPIASPAPTPRRWNPWFYRNYVTLTPNPSSELGTLVCGSPWAAWLLEGESAPYSQELQDRVAHFMNPAGFRDRDYFPLYSDTAAVKPYGPGCTAVDGCPLSDTTGTYAHLGTRYTDKDFCLTPWHFNSFWMTDDEIRWMTVSNSSAGELAPLYGGTTQLGSLWFNRSDTFVSYLQMVQAFIHSVAPITDVSLSVFSAATAAGGVTEGNPIIVTGPSVSPTVEKRWTGVTNLFDTIADSPESTRTGKILTDPVSPIEKLEVYVRDNFGSLARIGASARTIMPQLAWLRMLPHLNPVRFPNLKPASVQSHAGALYQFLKPVGYDDAVSYQLAQSGPWHWPMRYSFVRLGDDALSGAPYPQAGNTTYFISNPAAFFNPYYLGRYDWESDAVNAPTPVPTLYNYATGLLNATAPSPGGTAHWGVIQEARLACKQYKESRSAATGTPESEIVCFNVIVTDGKPAASCDQRRMDVFYGYGRFTCDDLSFEAHMTRIQDELNQFERLGEVLTFLVFLQHSPIDSETEEFLSLFETSASNKRVMLTFAYNDFEEFRQNLKSALGIILALIRTYSKLEG